MNKRIDIQNYEVFMIDYLDGNLAPELEAELLSFLDNHPEIKSEIEDFDLIKLKTNTDVYECKLDLKKSILDTGIINPENFEHYSIAYYEGDLSEKEQGHLLNYIKEHKSLAKEFKFMGNIQLKFDDSIEYQTKNELHQFASETTEPIDKENYEDFLIAFHEDDLSIYRKKELSLFLSQKDEYSQVSKSFKSFKLQSDKQITFINKSILKRNVIGIPRNAKWLSSIAASIALLFGSHIMFNTDSTNYTVNTNQRIAWQQEVPHIPISVQTVSIEESPVIAFNANTKPATQKPQKRNNELINSVSTLSGINQPVEGLSIQAQPYPMHIAQLRNETFENPDEALASNENEIKLKGLPAKVVSRMSNLLSKGNQLQDDKLKGKSKHFVELALSGYNLLTESNRSLLQDQPGDIHP